MRQTAVDPRFRYRVAMDDAIARGDDESSAWASYQRAAELAVRPEEEFELVRAQPKSGDWMAARSFVSYVADMSTDSIATPTVIGQMMKMLVGAGCLPSSIRFEKRHAVDRSGFDVIVRGVVA